jgi:hypothetical protein
VELMQKFRQNKICRDRKDTERREREREWEREMVEAAALNVKENDKEEKWSY